MTSAQQVVQQVISIATGSAPKKQAGAPKRKSAAKKKPAPKKPTGVRKPAKKPTKKPTKKKIAVNQCRAKDAKTGKRCTREVKGKELCPQEHKGHRMVYAQKKLRSAYA